MWQGIENIVQSRVVKNLLHAYPQISMGIEPGVESSPGCNRLSLGDDVSKIKRGVTLGKSQGK